MNEPRTENPFQSIIDKMNATPTTLPSPTQQQTTQPATSEEIRRIQEELEKIKNHTGPTYDVRRRKLQTRLEQLQGNNVEPEIPIQGVNTFAPILEKLQATPQTEEEKEEQENSWIADSVKPDLDRNRMAVWDFIKNLGVWRKDDRKTAKEDLLFDIGGVAPLPLFQHLGGFLYDIPQALSDVIVPGDAYDTQRLDAFFDVANKTLNPKAHGGWGEYLGYIKDNTISAELRQIGRAHV